MQFDQKNTTAATAANSSKNDSTHDNKASSKKSTAATKKIATSAVSEKSKRKQVKNACVNCQKACKKCDDGRPCKRCVKLGLTATCRDSDRKERKKGVKRGPYKKRQAYIKDKPVYPKLTEEHWNQPIYETVPQVLSQNNNQSIYNDFYDDGATSYCVPSQSNNKNMSLSPLSVNSFVDETDETLHYAYGYGYTNTTPVAPLTIATTVTNSPPTLNMLDHQYQTSSISGNVTPTCYSWDDNYMEGSSPTTSTGGYHSSLSSGSSSPIGCAPIINHHDSHIVQFQQPFPTTTDIIYQAEQQHQQKELSSSSSIIIQQPIFDLNQMVQQELTSPISPIDDSSYWYYNNDMPIEFHQPSLITAPLVIPQQQQQHYFEYTIASQQQQYSSWTF